MANSSVAPGGGVPAFQAPAVDPLAPAVLASQQRLATQQSADEIATNNVQSRIQAISTASGIRNNFQSTFHAMSQQATTLSNQYIGDAIAQSKKTTENSGKAT